MKIALSFNDVLLIPKFSTIKTRKDVLTKVLFLGEEILPIISSNMDAVTGPEMIKAMTDLGARACLHRFQSIEDNVKQFVESGKTAYVSIGLGENELERAKALVIAGAKRLVIDVAHGASLAVIEQVAALRDAYGSSIYLIVGNFADIKSIDRFKYHLNPYKVDAWKVGIGGGSACTTRIVTGVGLPTFQSILDCSKVEEPIIADGGIKNSGDFVKALAAGATAVMIGGMLAGTDESSGNSIMRNLSMYPGTEILPGDKVFVPTGQEPFTQGCLIQRPTHKRYRGSASQESYEAQGKTSEWRTAEGESFLVPYTGPVANIIQQLEAGLRSSMSYLGANNLLDFKRNAEFVQITNNGVRENEAHGKNHS